MGEEEKAKRGNGRMGDMCVCVCVCVCGGGGGIGSELWRERLVVEIMEHLNQK